MTDSSAVLRPPVSIAARLFMAVGLILFVGGVLVTIAAFAYGHAAAQSAYDRLLVGAANQISASIAVVDGDPLVDLPVPALELLSLARNDRIGYRVADGNGVTITGQETIALPGADDDLVYFNGELNGEDARFVSVPRRFAERGFSGTLYTIVGHTTLARQALAREIAVNAWVVLGFAGLGMAGLSWFAVRSALSPLRRIEDRLQARDPKDLTPLDIAVPAELRTIVDAINRFMGLVGRQIEGMQNLISDSAHQLRTPIAALRAQSQIALEEQDPKNRVVQLERIYAKSVELSRLTDQLLNHALVIHRADFTPHTLVDLRSVASAAADAFSDGQIFENRKLRLNLPDEPLMVMGDELSLTEASKNLISNALHHATPPVTITVSSNGKAAILSVSDSGPGLSLRQADEMQMRFTAGTLSTGTGIGLAIASAVAKAHGTKLEIFSNSAKRFEIGFCLPSPNARENAL